MNTNNENQVAPVITEENSTLARNSFLAEEVNQIGVSKIGYAYIYEKKDIPTLSDAELIFRYDEAGNQILREMLLQ